MDKTNEHLAEVFDKLKEAGVLLYEAETLMGEGRAARIIAGFRVGVDELAEMANDLRKLGAG